MYTWMSKGRQLLLWGIFQVLLGLYLFIYLIIYCCPYRFSFYDGLICLILLILGLISHHLRFLLSSEYFISFDITFSLCSLFLYGLLPGGIVFTSTISLDHLRRKWGEMDMSQWVLFMDNFGNRLIRVSAGYLCYKAFGGKIPPDSLFPFIPFFAAYFVANILFFIPTEYFKGNSMKRYIKTAVSEDVFYTIIITFLGMALSIIYNNEGPAIFSFLSFLILGTSWALYSLGEAKTNLKNRINDLEILDRVSSSASSSLDVLPTVEAFTRTLANNLKVDGIGVIFYHKYTSTLYLVQCEGEKSRSTYLPDDKRQQYGLLPLSEPSARLGERLFEFLEPLETAPFRIPPSVFGLPLMHGGEPFGGIVAYSYLEGALIKNSQGLLETCTRSLVVALENCFLHLQAIEDPLTGLYNRSYFLFRLEEEMAYATRHKNAFSLMMLDLDDFKIVNDTLGHQAGDMVLRKVGETLRGTLRREDVPARYGGDEFIILLIACDVKSAGDLASRLSERIQGIPSSKKEMGIPPIGASISIFTSDSISLEDDIPGILRRLDSGLYKAKGMGNNHIVFC